ncbi:unnamed protein product [Schistocephalus solidus]|uniref:CG1689 n=1 Tax=Schistocephalus solidus TaxID=70667 RepID=A0A183SR77_SCHSO|nr:unnamed protein product [Schistocephalus solidus]
MITRELTCLLLPLISCLAVQGAVLNYGGYQPFLQQFRNLNPLQGHQQQQVQQQQQQPAHQWSYASMGQPVTVRQPQQTTFSAPAASAAPLGQYLQLFNGLQGSNGAGAYDSSTSGLGSAQPADNLFYSVLPAAGSQTPVVSATAGVSGSEAPIVSGTSGGGGSSFLDASGSAINQLYSGLYSPVVGSPTDGVLGANGGILGTGDDTALVDSTGDAQYYLGPSAFQSGATVDANGVFQITPEAAEQHRQQDERLRQLLIKHFTTSPFHRNNNNNGQINSIGQFPLVSATGTGTYLQSQQPQQQQQVSIPLTSYL